MIEAVIWDFGGVMTTSPFEAFTRFETERGLPADIIRRTNAANHLENAWAKFERAEVDLETEFLARSPAIRLDVLKRLATVDAGFSFAQHVQVWPVQDENRLRHRVFH